MRISLGHLFLFWLLAAAPFASASARELKVDCRPQFLEYGGSAQRPAPEKEKVFSSVTAAVATLTAAPSYGPHLITVTGACQENILIAGVDNLTLQASAQGASLNDVSNGASDTLFIGTSHSFVLNGFTINGSVSCVESECTSQGNTIQNAQIGYGLRFSRSLGTSTEDTIQNIPGIGVVAANGSHVLLEDDIVQNNAGDGAQATNGALLILTNYLTTTTITNNGGNGVTAHDHGTVRLEVANIVGNAGDGVGLQGSALLRMEFAAPYVNTITANGAAGVDVGDLSYAFFPGDGSATVAGHRGGVDVLCSGQYAATSGALTNLNGGTTNCQEPAAAAAKSKVKAGGGSVRERLQ